MINIDIKNSKETYWASLFIDINAAVYFDSFGIDYIPLKLIKKKSKINRLLTIYLEYKIMNLLCVDFIVSLS